MQIFCNWSEKKTNCNAVPSEWLRWGGGSFPVLVCRSNGATSAKELLINSNYLPLGSSSLNKSRHQQLSIQITLINIIGRANSTFGPDSAGQA